MLATNSPPAIVTPAPVSPVGTEFQQTFNSAATPSVRAWVDAEATTLGSAVLDLQRLGRDAAVRAAGAPMPDTAALFLRYAVELRLQSWFDARSAVLKARPPKPVPTSSPSPAAQNDCILLAATQQMQETQMSFNLQYLELQENIQNDSRQYTAVSNVLKARADTVKNVLANIK